MKRRAAATAAGLAAGLAPTTVQGVAPSMADEAMGEEGYEEEDTNQEAALKEAARLRREKYIERLTVSPPRRFWWLLLLWLVGGTFGFASCSAEGVACHCGSVGVRMLGVTLMLIATLTLHPMVIPLNRYKMQEAYIVAGVGFGFASLSAIMWIRDGILLTRRRLQPRKGDGDGAAAAPTNSASSSAITRTTAKDFGGGRHKKGSRGALAAARAQAAREEAMRMKAAFKEDGSTGIYSLCGSFSAT